MSITLWVGVARGDLPIRGTPSHRRAEGELMRSVLKPFRKTRVKQTSNYRKIFQSIAVEKKYM